MVREDTRGVVTPTKTGGTGRERGDLSSPEQLLAQTQALHEAPAPSQAECEQLRVLFHHPAEPGQRRTRAQRGSQRRRGARQLSEAAQSARIGNPHHRRGPEMPRLRSANHLWRNGRCGNSGRWDARPGHSPSARHSTGCRAAAFWLHFRICGPGPHPKMSVEERTRAVGVPGLRFRTLISGDIFAPGSTGLLPRAARLGQWGFHQCS